MTLVRFQKPTYEPTVNDLFNSFYRAYEKPFEKRVCNSPAVNVSETDEAFELEFSVPGYKKDQFQVSNENGTLIVKATVDNNEDTKSYTLKRFSVEGFERKFEIPEHVDVESISATYADGILTVVLPKKEEVKQEQKIEVKVK